MKKVFFVLMASSAIMLQCTGGGKTDLEANNPTMNIDSLIDKAIKIMYENPDGAKASMEELLLTSYDYLNKEQEAMLYLQIGTIYSMKMELAKSDSLYLKAIHTLSNVSQPCLLSSIQINLGINQSKKGAYSSAIAFYQQAAGAIEKQADQCVTLPDRIYNNLGLAYQSIGKPDSAKFYFEKVLYSSTEKNDKRMMASALVNLGIVVYGFEEYETAETYLLQAIALYEEENNKNGVLTAYSNLATAYKSQKKYDDALLVYIKADSLATILNIPSRKGLIYHNTGSLYYDMGDYTKSLEYLEKSLAIKTQFNDSAGMALSQNAMSAVYIETGNYKGAKELAEKALIFAQRENNTTLLSLLYQNLTVAYIHLGEKEAALETLVKKDALRDSTFSKQKIEAVQEWQVKYETSQKETEIQLLTERNLAQNKIMFLYLIIIVLLIVAMGLGILWMMNHRKKTFMQLDNLKYRTVKSKFMPHFTGNVLNSINYLISKNPTTAQKFIADFSTFTNQSLFNFDQITRSLEEEIKYADNYLKLEKLRYEDDLNYSIEVSEDVDLRVEIPTMIMQTFCENALKHGIRPRNGHGTIKINAYSQAHFLVVTVEDDGIGRAQAQALKTEGSREGLKIVEQQIRLFNKKKKSAMRLEIVDLYSDDKTPVGTRFELYMAR